MNPFTHTKYLKILAILMIISGIFIITTFIEERETIVGQAYVLSQLSLDLLPYNTKQYLISDVNIKKGFLEAQKLGKGEEYLIFEYAKKFCYDGHAEFANLKNYEKEIWSCSKLTIYQKQNLLN